MPSSRFRTPRRRLLSATVTAAAAAALALPLAVAGPANADTPAAPAPATAGTAAPAPAAPSPDAATSGTVQPMLPGGTVKQPNGPVEVIGGQPISANTWFTAQLPANVTGTVHAAVVFSGSYFGPGDTAVQHSAEHLHGLCAVGEAGFETCPWHGDPYDETDPYRGDVWLSLPSVPAATEITYNVRIGSDFGLFSEDKLLTGWIELTDDDGTPLADGPAQIQYRRGVEPASMRSALYGRDAAGVLWRYEGTDRSLGDAPFKPRVRVGGGWNVYTAITPLTTPTAAATGDMVARDKDGVLWYYQHSSTPDHPFQYRKRVGGGWNVYTAIAGTNRSVNGVQDRSVGDLVARDRSGVLWWYRATGDPEQPFEPRVRVGGGWNIYTSIIESQSGLLARDASGVLWKYDHWSMGAAKPFEPRMRVGGGWNIYTALADTLSGHAVASSGLVARDRSGKLWVYDSDYYGPTVRSLVGGGWNIYTMLF